MNDAPEVLYGGLSAGRRCSYWLMERNPKPILEAFYPILGGLSAQEMGGINASFAPYLRLIYANKRYWNL